MFGLDPEIAYHLEKTKKQDFLRDEILMKGFNQVEFAQYIDSKRGKKSVLLIERVSNSISFIRQPNLIECREWDGYRQLELQ